MKFANLLKLMLRLEVSGLVAIAASTAAIGLFGMKASNAAPSDTVDRPSEFVIAYENMCADDELVAGDEVEIDGEVYPLEEDEDGLYIEYMLVDEEGDDTGEGVGTYSLTEFGDDCETVTFEAIDGTDSIIGDDVDEESDMEEMEESDM